MTKGVVDDLEVVEIDIQKRDHRLFAARNVDRLGQTVREQGSIGQFGQGVVVRLKGDFGFVLFALGDVVNDGQDRRITIEIDDLAAEQRIKDVAVGGAQAGLEITHAPSGPDHRGVAQAIIQVVPNDDIHRGFADHFVTAVAQHGFPFGVDVQAHFVGQAGDDGGHGVGVKDAGKQLFRLTDLRIGALGGGKQRADQRDADQHHQGNAQRHQFGI